LSNNVIKLDDYRKDNISYEDLEDDYCEIEESLVIGWADDGDGGKSLHIISSVDTDECIWMIDLAKKIVESRPADKVIDNE
tara:strand:- start:870 stop:1112 length:243 start_codon:yes stop_codon:yes gene_type:complete